jgi:hypothetical protein
MTFGRKGNRYQKKTKLRSADNAFIVVGANILSQVHTRRYVTIIKKHRPEKKTQLGEEDIYQYREVDGYFRLEIV